MYTVDNKTTNMIKGNTYHETMDTPCFQGTIAMSPLAAPNVVMPMSSFLDLANKQGDVKPEKIYYRDRYTTVVWKDGTTTTVCCGENETFDKYSGFCAALAKKVFGSTTHVKGMIEKLDVEENKRKAAESKAREKEAARKAEEERIERARQRRIERGVKKEIERWMIEEAADEMILKIMEDRRNAEAEDESVSEMSGEACGEACESCQSCDEAHTEVDNG